MTRNDWIACSARLPEYDVPVLLFAPCGDAHGECFVAERRQSYHTDPSRRIDYWSGDYSLEIGRASHWAPIVSPNGEKIL